MSLVYILDGYNIIKRHPKLVEKSLEDGREGLIRLIDIHRPQGSVNNSVTVVFDGRPGMTGGVRSSHVRVIFTVNETADERIKAMVEESCQRRQLVVVTDDRDIRYHVRSLGARLLGVDEFLAKTNDPRPSSVKKRAAERSKDDPKVISAVLEHKITSEFEQIWLKKDVGRKR